jgi:hypothetical protein
MALSSIELIDADVRNGAHQVDENEDGADGYVLIDGGIATDMCNAVRDVWWLQTSQRPLLVKKSW